MIQQFQFAITEETRLAPIPDYGLCQPLGVLSSLPAGEPFETRPVGPARGTRPDGTPVQFIFWGRLLYAEMNGARHESGFALMVAPFGAAALEWNNDSYNYYT